MRKILIGVLVTGLVATSAAMSMADPSAGRRAETTLRFLDVRQQTKFLDLGAPAQGDFDPSPGDTFFFESDLRNPADTKSRGSFVSRCTAVIGTQFHCVGTLMLDGGNVELATTTDFASSEPITAAVVGGTRAYDNVGGQAKIISTDTEGTSKLVLNLVSL